jgi:hypothetical protein
LRQAIRTLPGYATFVSDEAIREWRRTPIEERFEWLEEMIRFQAALPEPIRRLHERFRRGEIRPRARRSR